MTGSDLIRRLRGLVGNALFWGVTWFVGVMVVSTVLRFLGMVGGSWLGQVMVSGRFAVIGTITGTAFSLFIGIRYHGRRLTEISWLRFGIGGGIVAALFVPTFIIVARFLSGDAFLAWSHLIQNGLIVGAFGGVSAAASLKLAQVGERALPGSEQRQELERGEEEGADMEA